MAPLVGEFLFSAMECQTGHFGMRWTGRSAAVWWFQLQEGGLLLALHSVFDIVSTFFCSVPFALPHLCSSSSKVPLFLRFVPLDGQGAIRSESVVEGCTQEFWCPHGTPCRAELSCLFQCQKFCAWTVNLHGEFPPSPAIEGHEWEASRLCYKCAKLWIVAFNSFVNTGCCRALWLMQRVVPERAKSFEQSDGCEETFLGYFLTTC